MMMMLVFVLDVTQNLERFLLVGSFYKHLLETAFQGAIFLDAVAIFIKSRSADALNGSACQSWFHNVGSIHCARGRPRTNHGVNLVYKYNNVGILFDFINQCLDAFFKLTAIFRASHNAGHVKTDNTFIEKHR